MMTELPPQSEYRWGRRYRQQPVLLLIEVHVRCCFRHMAKLGQGQGQPFSLSYSVSQIVSPRNARRVTVFVGAAGFLANLSLMNDLPLQCEH